MEKYSFLDKIKNLDRRVVYFVVFLSILLPFLPGFGFLQMPFETKPETEHVFEYIENLNEGDPVFLDWSFDPSVKAELLPFAKAFLKQAFRKKLRVFIYYSMATASGLGQETLKEISATKEFGYIEEGKNYAQLQWLGSILPDIYIVNMASDFKGTFRKEGPIFEGINTIKDLKYIVIAAGNKLPQYYIDMQIRFGYTLGIAVTAVSGPDFIPYLQTGQINGMVNGLRGAAEYELLLSRKYNNPGDKGTAFAGMASLTLSHVTIIGFIILGNLIHFAEQRRKKSKYRG